MNVMKPECITLKPCPFCGATEDHGNLVITIHPRFNVSETKELLLNSDEVAYSIKCKKCGTIGPTEFNEFDAADTWNTMRISANKEERCI